MQFYSDYSSEEDPNDEFHPWNPNEFIDQIMATEDVATKAKLKKELIQTFLDQQRPMLTSKMREFLVEDGIVEILTSFVTRLHESELKANPPRLRPLNPSDDEEIVRRSFNVMELFLNPMNDLDVLLEEKIEVLLRELFSIFDSTSSGNFHHMSKIMEQLLVRAPVETVQTLVGEKLLWKALDFLHESPIVDLLIEIFCASFPKQSDTIQFYKALVDAKVFEKISEKIIAPGSWSAPYASDFFIKLLEKLSAMEMSGILFISLCRSSAFIDSLFKVLTTEDGTYPMEQRHAAANVLKELLLKSGEKMFEQTEYGRPLPNMLSAVHDKLHLHALPHLPKLAQVLIQLDGQKKSCLIDRDSPLAFSAFTVKRPFGTFRFVCTEILSDLIVCNPEVLDSMPQAAWRVLSQWFIEYSHNNLYHSLFFKMLQMVIRENHEDSLKAILQDAKFLSKVIDQYHNPQGSADKTDAKGFMILIGNTIRLAADSQPAGTWLRHYLVSHDAWKEFLPKLKADTEVQLKRSVHSCDDLTHRYDDITLDLMDDDDEEGLEDDLDTELGSAYARSLGFDAEGPPPEELVPQSPKKKKKKRRNRKKKSAAQLNSDTPQSEEKKRGNEEEFKPEVTADASWWKDIKQEFNQEQKKEEDVAPSGDDWWSSMKEELKAIEQQ